MRARRIVAVALALAAPLALTGAMRPAGGVPALVLVSRAVRADGAIPGLGPAARTPLRGRLLVRERDGRVRELAPKLRFDDVAAPAVSWDGRTVAFAAVERGGSRWRLWRIDAAGRDLAPLAAAEGAHDDFDPCWLPDGRLMFASTRGGYANPGVGAASNLFVIDSAGAAPRRLTAERHGAEAPAVDPRDGRLVYARWWFNRWRATDDDARGITDDLGRSLPADTVSLWHAVTATDEAEGVRLAGGDPRTRAGQMAYQPLVLGDGTLYGVATDPASLARAPGRAWLHRHAGGFAPAVRVPLGAAAQAVSCAPVALPDGRIAFAHDPQGGGDLGVWVMRADGRGAARLFDLPGTHELDPAPLVARTPPPLRPRPPAPLAFERPATRLEQLTDRTWTFRFDCLNVFAQGAVDAPFPDAPRMERDLRIRFFAVLSRPEAAGGDTVVLVRESAVMPSGAVHEDDLPADVPMFEQLVDSKGRLVRSTGGPAHVAGFNFAPLGSGTKCVGCHTGHSALAVAPSAEQGKWTNASPSAEATVLPAAGVAAGPPSDARAVADRRANGNPREVAWVAEGGRDGGVRLTWKWPIEARAVVLYAPSAGFGVRAPASGEVRLLRNGREVRRMTWDRALAASGTRIAFPPERVDALELRLPAGGRGAGHLAIAEIETEGRLLEE